MIHPRCNKIYVESPAQSRVRLEPKDGKTAKTPKPYGIALGYI